MPGRGRAPAFLRGQETEGAQIVVRWSIQVDQALLPQLHHRDCGEGLGDGADPKDRVLGHRYGRLDASDAVTGKLERSIPNHSHRQTNSRPAIQDAINIAGYFELIDLRHGWWSDSSQGRLCKSLMLPRLHHVLWRHNERAMCLLHHAPSHRPRP